MIGPFTLHPKARLISPCNTTFLSAGLVFPFSTFFVSISRMIPLDFLLTAHVFSTDDRSLYYLRIYHRSLAISMNLIYQRGIYSFANSILSSRDVYIYSFRYS